MLAVYVGYCTCRTSPVSCKAGGPLCCKAWGFYYIIIDHHFMHNYIHVHQLTFKLGSNRKWVSICQIFLQTSYSSYSPETFLMPNFLMYSSYDPVSLVFMFYKMYITGFLKISNFLNICAYR